jgi:amino acid transporter
MAEAAKQKPSMNVWGVAALGVGAMVGAGIFALLGEVALVAHGAAWIAFIAGGIIAMFSGYSYARLAATYPSDSGIVAFFNAGLPARAAAGSFSLIYLLTLAVSSALIAKSFGAYAARLAFGDGAAPIWIDLFATAIVIGLTVLNAVGSRAVARAEIVLVAVKLLTLGALLVAGSTTFSAARLGSAHEVGLSSIIAAVGLTFFAYSGYGIMANASGDVAKPNVVIPRAIYGAIGFVILLYVAVSVIVLGNVSQADLVKYADTAVAQAAKPVLGSAGFIAVSIAALLATASAINAILFSSMNIAQGLGKARQLPGAFTTVVRGKLSRGVLVAVVGVLAIINFLDLSAIADVASAAFLITYLAVFVAHWRLVKETKSSRVVIGVGACLMAVVLAVFETSVYRKSVTLLWLTVGLVVAAVAIELVLARTARSKPALAA